MAFRGLHWREEEPAAPEHHPFLPEDGSEFKDACVGRRRVKKERVQHWSSKNLTNNYSKLQVFLLKFSFLMPSQKHGNNYGEEKPGQDHLSSTRGLYFLDTSTTAINKSCLTLSHSLLHSCVTLLCAFSQLGFLARLLALLQIILNFKFSVF